MRSITKTEIKVRFWLIKYTKLTFCIIMDLIGMLSYTAPDAADITDLIWAFIHIALLHWMFTERGTHEWGFWEELLPFTDIIPSASLSWHKSYVKQADYFYAAFLDKIKKKYTVID